MSDYKAITALLGGRGKPDLQETLLNPLQSLLEKTNAISGVHPTIPNQQAKQSFEGMADRLMTCLAPANPLNLFKKG
ncbi:MULTISPECIES: hypothetical protein [unclassified Legionella]|uniref:hypothetical protein n=1 Tax=unclassified Legionella TaxID=2622702 RepID=UPI001E3A9174|nr:hypothetical protein [Legionella sp. 31fI33]MCC5014856.1 hypothetical protein [Legionella sp. 31fI33]